MRQEVCDALQHAAPKAVPAADGSGDQRYFRVDVVYEGEAQISFDVPEADAPETLVRLWKSQAGQSG